MAKEKAKEPNKKRIYTKIKILNKSININFDEVVETNDGDYMRNSYSAECEQAAHPDFVNALDEMKGHLVLIAEYSEVKDHKEIDEKLLKQFKVTGFSISGQDETEGIVLTGMRRLKTGRQMNVVPPMLRFQDNDGYHGIGEMYAESRNVIVEADKYLNGKFGAGTQTAISFEASMKEEVEED